MYKQNREIAFNSDFGFYDDGPKYSDFYEKEYLKINPEMHDEDSGAKMRIVTNLLDNLFSGEVKVTMTNIIDVGSGSGKVLDGVVDYISRNHSKPENIIAVDISGEILKKIKTKNDIIKLRADSTNLPFLDKSYDLIMMMDLIEHTEDPSAVLEESLRVAEYVLIKTPLELSLYTFFRGGRARLKKMEEKYGHIQHFRKSSVLKLLHGCSIISESYEKIPGRSVFHDKFQDFLINFKFFALFRFLFGGFIILLIKRN